MNERTSPARPRSAVPRGATRSRWLLLAAAIATLATGCSLVGASPSPPPAASAEVRPGQGTRLHTSFADLRVPAGAVSAKTTARLGQQPAGESDAMLFEEDFRAPLRPVAGTKPISVDLSGAQPSTPLTLRFKVPEEPPGGATLVLVTSRGGVPSLLATNDVGGGYAEASLAHLSLFTPVWLMTNKVLNLAAATVNDVARTLTQGESGNTSFAGCTSQAVTLDDGSDVSVAPVPNAARQARGTPLALCLKADGTGVVMSVESDDASPWRVATAPAGRWRRDGIRSTDQALVDYTYQFFVNALPGEGAITAFGSGKWDVEVPAGGSAVVSATVSQQVYWVTIATFAVAMVGAVYAGGLTSKSGTLDKLTKAALGSKETTDCMAGAFGSMADAIAQNTPTPESSFSSGIACAPKVLKAAGLAAGVAAQAAWGIVLAILTQGVPLVIAGTNGAYRGITGANMDWRLTRSAPPAPVEDSAGPSGSGHGGFPAIPEGSWGSYETELRVSSDGTVWLLSEGTSCQDPLMDAKASGCQQVDIYQVTGDRDISGDGTEMDVRAKHLSSGYYAMNWPTDLSGGPSTMAGPKAMGQVEPDSDITISFFEDPSSVVVYNPMPTAFCSGPDSYECP